MLRMAYVSFLVIVLILIITSVNLSNFVLDNDIKEIIIYDKDILNNFRKAVGLSNDLNDYEIIKKIKDDEQKENRLTWYNEQRDAEINNLNNRINKINGEIGVIDKEITKLEQDQKKLTDYLNEASNPKTINDIDNKIKEINILNIDFETKTIQINDLKYYRKLIDDGGIKYLEENIDELKSDRQSKLDEIKNINEVEIPKITVLKFTDPDIKEYKSFYNSIKDKDLVKYVFLTEDEYSQLSSLTKAAKDSLPIGLTQEQLNSLSENQRLYLSSRDPINNYIIGFSSVFLITFLISSFYLYLTISDYNNITSLIGVILTIIAFLITLMIEKNGNELTEKDNQMIGNIIGWSMIPILIVMIFNRPINNNAGWGFLMFMIALCLICLSLIFGFNKNIEDKTMGWNDNFTGVLVGIGLAICFPIIRSIYNSGINPLQFIRNLGMNMKYYTKSTLFLILILIVITVLSVLADKETVKDINKNENYKNYMVTISVFSFLVLLIFCYFIYESFK